MRCVVACMFTASAPAPCSRATRAPAAPAAAARAPARERLARASESASVRSSRMRWCSSRPLSVRLTCATRRSSASCSRETSSRSSSLPTMRESSVGLMLSKAARSESRTGPRKPIVASTSYWLGESSVPAWVRRRPRDMRPITVRMRLAISSGTARSVADSCLPASIYLRMRYGEGMDDLGQPGRFPPGPETATSGYYGASVRTARNLVRRVPAGWPRPLRVRCRSR